MRSGSSRVNTTSLGGRPRRIFLSDAVGGTLGVYSVTFENL